MPLRKTLNENSPVGIRYALIVCALWALLGTNSLGQLTGIIQGQITDASGARVPGATVTATNEATGVSRTAVSADDGFYRIADLLAGIYRVRVELPGFKVTVNSDVSVTGKSILGLNLTLEIGEVTDSVEVRAEGLQVETQVVRISEVLPEEKVRSLPMQGRGILTLIMITPGIVGKKLNTDVFSAWSAPRINSGANEQKALFALDGIDLRYTEGSGWGASFSPNPDAVQEVRISTDPQSSAEFGRTSGPQVQIVTKGGTNSLHGTAHLVFQDNELNARPFFSRSVPDTSYKLFGGTVGGPIVKNRLFFFGAFEGLRATVAGTSRQLVETEAFRDFVTKSRPNTIAAKLLQAFPPLAYPTQDLKDVGGPSPGVFNWTKQPDGIPDLGLITIDSVRRRDGTQFNTRIDFHAPNDKDRIFGTYWYSNPESISPRPRPAFDWPSSVKIQSGHFTHTRAFSPSTFNEARFGADYIDSGQRLVRFAHIPATFSDDGFGIGRADWFIYNSDVYYLEDVVSLDRGKHAFRFGITYRHALLESGWPNAPRYQFASILDFADDEPYLEERVVDTKGGQAIDSELLMSTGDFSLFFQNTWQIRSNLTLNYGLRWETFFPVWVQDRENWQPHLSAAQITPREVAQVANTHAKNRIYSRDLNNFGPRMGLSWDPSRKGKMAIRFGFGVLYDEINTFNLNGVVNNPPALVSLSAGPQLGIPIVYGLAPEGTNNYPINPVLTRPKLSEQGGIVGQRVNLRGFATDLQAPRIWDTMTGIQYQLADDVMVQINYKYRRGTNELYMDDVNRFAGDLLDGGLDRLNQHFNRIEIVTNRGKRMGHNLIANLTKRFSQGWSVSGSYTYANARNNFGSVAPGNSDYYQSGATDAFDLDLEWARDDIPHTFTAHSIWQLPVLRGRSDWVGRLLGGWELNTIWNFQAGGLFIPSSTATFKKGGDFNADGQTTGFRGAGGDRPDQPTTKLPSSFSKEEWLRGVLQASVFPLPDPSAARTGTLARDAFRLPGYANIDAAFVKEFTVPIWGQEDARIQIRGELFNVLNRLNISTVQNRINAPNFARATGAYPNREVQLGVKFLF